MLRPGDSTQPTADGTWESMATDRHTGRAYPPSVASPRSGCPSRGDVSSALMEELITPYERARRPLSQIPLQIWTVIHGSLKIADISHKTPTVARTQRLREANSGFCDYSISTVTLKNLCNALVGYAQSSYLLIKLFAFCAPLKKRPKQCAI